MNKDELENISGGYWPWEGVYIVNGACTGCLNCLSKKACPWEAIVVS